MARGRMLNKTISASLKFQQLPDDTCRLMATWIIAHLDKNGVFYGEPMMVRSFIFPRRDDITLEQVELYLDKMIEIGLIEIFEADGQAWQHWPGFQDNQIGLRADRESTEYPLPPNRDSNDGGNTSGPPNDMPPDSQSLYEQLPETSQQDTGNLPENIPPNMNLKEVNINITEHDIPPPKNQPSTEAEQSLKAMVTNYEDFISVTINPIIADTFNEYAPQVKPQWVNDAFKCAIKANARNWNYIEAILDSCIRAGHWVDKAEFKRRNGATNGHQRTNQTRSPRGQPASGASDPAAIRAEIERAKQKARAP